ncbi:MAG: hypothetical protein DRO12_04665, partial [Thermoprotei archaeon]
MQNDVEVPERVNDEVFKLLSNRLNLQIILLLSSAELYPRELARILGKNETEISRRLNALRRAGLIECKWRRIGERNVKLCTSDISELKIELQGTNLVVRYGRRREKSLRQLLLSRSLVEDAPSVDLFVDRERELEVLKKRRCVLVWGFPGTGKTMLLARYASTYRGPVFWYHVTRFSDYKHMLWRAGVYFSLLNMPQLLKYVTSERVNLGVALDLFKELTARTSTLVVIDDLHNTRDRNIIFFVKELIEKCRVEVKISSRVMHPELLSEGLYVLKLNGLDEEAVGKLLELRGLKLSREYVKFVTKETLGIPILVNMFINIAGEDGVERSLDSIKLSGIPSIFEELYSSLTYQEKQLLMVLSVLENPVPASLITRLFGESRARRLINSLIQRGLITSSAPGYYLHDLVRRNLVYEPSAVENFLREAASYYEEQEDFMSRLRAIELYLKLGDEDKIMALIKDRIESYSPDYLHHASRYREVLKGVLRWAKNPVVRGLALSELGRIEFFTGKIRAAGELLREALKFLGASHDRRYVACRAFTLELLGRVYVDLGLYGEALKILREVIRVSTEIDDAEVRNKLLFVTYADIARLYTFLRNHELVITYTELEYERALEVDDAIFLGYATMHIGYTYFEAGELGKAQPYLEHALEILVGSWSDIPRAHTHAVLARLYARKGDFDKALRHCREALHLYAGYGLK